jgi:hypothetical protein
MNGRPEVYVRVLRTSVDEALDRLTEDRLEHRIAVLEREVEELAGTDDAQRSRWELDGCRLALLPDFRHHSYHTRACYVPDQRHSTRRKLLVPLSQVPVDAQPCRHCAPPRPPRTRRDKPDRDTERTGADEHGSVIVRVGMTVDLVDDSGKEWTYDIVREGAGGAPGRVSVEAPMGNALLGAEVGDVRLVPRPKGGDLRVRVIGITPTS